MCVGVWASVERSRRAACFGGDAADATFDDLVQAEALLKDTYARFRRVMGDGHPDTAKIHKTLLATREDLARARASSHA